MKVLISKQTGFLSRRDLQNSAGKRLYYCFVIFGFLIVLVCLLPAIWILLSSLKGTEELFRIPPTLIPEKLYFDKIPRVWQLLGFARYYRNSFIVVIGSVACGIFFNGLLGYCFSVLKPRGHRVMFVLVLWSLMIPNIVSLAPLFANIVSLGLNNRFLTLWLSFGANAFWTVLYKNFFDNIPRSFAESAQLDGCSKFSIFLRIYVPLSLPMNLVIAIFAFNAAWSEFLLSYLVLQDINLHTVMIKLFTMTEAIGMSADYRLVAITFSIIPPAIIFILFQKWIDRGISFSSGMKV